MKREETFVIFDMMDTLYSHRKGLYDDVKPVLQLLKQNNIYLGIISSLSPEVLDEILLTYNLKDFFDVVISAKQYDTFKPDPKLIQICITLLKDKKNIEIKKENTYYVGDRPDVDVRMARLAGIKAIRIIRGKYALKEEEDDLEKPHYTIKYLDELKNILKLKNISEEKEDSFNNIETL